MRGGGRWEKNWQGLTSSKRFEQERNGGEEGAAARTRRRWGALASGAYRQRGCGRRNGASPSLSMFSGCARRITLLLAQWFEGGEERWKRMIDLHSGSCKAETRVRQAPPTFSFPGFELVEGYSWPDNTESVAGLDNEEAEILPRIELPLRRLLDLAEAPDEESED
ncbi:hypothetical protein VNO77_31316 [Canavalia gladiata]|uniref:Uncharacterized protein n=1 Tax=Canavalia gladiata TaxID=3824 RepID=A0AAN9KQA1_CANGL